MKELLAEIDRTTDYTKTMTSNSSLIKPKPEFSEYIRYLHEVFSKVEPRKSLVTGLYTYEDTFFEEEAMVCLRISHFYTLPGIAANYKKKITPAYTENAPISFLQVMKHTKGINFMQWGLEGIEKLMPSRFAGLINFRHLNNMSKIEDVLGARNAFLSGKTVATPTSLIGLPVSPLRTKDKRLVANVRLEVFEPHALNITSVWDWDKQVPAITVMPEKKEPLPLPY